MAISISMAAFGYVLKADRKGPKEEQTVFTLKRLSARENAQIEDGVGASIRAADVANGNINAKIGIEQSPGTTVIETLRIGLRGWKRFFDADGEAVVFVEPSEKGPYAGLCPYKNMDMISPANRHELAEAIDQGNVISEEDSKNSPSEPTL